MQPNKIGNKINYTGDKITAIDFICSAKGPFSKWRYFLVSYLL